ncbi:MAG: hypothetical protein ACR2NX_00665 [Chthoniobacterales bacterium]
MTASDCWAVGNVNGAVRTTLTEHWDGRSWAIVPSPNAGTQENPLRGVSCVTASDCWAAGYSSNDGVAFQTVTEHWNGNSWAIVPSPNITPTGANTLQGVSCVGASDCWAAGYSSSNGVTQTLTEHWNGISWAIVTSANTSPNYNLLSGVTCVAASDCWAVGRDRFNTDFITHTLTEHWNGSSWAIVPSPDTDPTRNNSLTGVTCVAASDCWAVGDGKNASSDQTLTEHWNGSSWAIVPSPNTDPAQNNQLYSVTCVASSDCWAVGNAVNQTLIEHYAVPAVTLAGVASTKTHGSAGAFGINLPLSGNLGIECRSGGATGDYTLVFTFTNTLASVGSASVSAGTGSVASSGIGADAHQYLVNLTGVANAQVLGVSLSNVNDSAGNSSSAVPVSMGVLLGDTTGNGTVSATDVGQTKAFSGQPLDATNFRADVNLSGGINASDIGVVKANSGTTLP